jgi:predicted nucleotidyltransferase
MHILDFRVFGSRARGDGDEFSDLDIFIKVDEINKDIRRQIKDIAWELGFEHSILIAPVIVSRKEIDGIDLDYSPIYSNVLKEGVLV